MLSQNQFSASNMYDVIATSFFQKKSCKLPGIGQLVFTNTAAVTNFSNNQIMAPKQTITFIPVTNEKELSFNEFSAISELMKRQLETNGQVIITGVGSFTQLSGGRLNFRPIYIAESFVQPVSAIPIVRQDAEHNVLVGDIETNSKAMNEKLQTRVYETVKKDWWWVWAIAGFAIAAAAIGYYIYEFGFNNLGSGIGKT